MKKEAYKYNQYGFEAILYDAENGDDRLLIVIQGLKGLDLPEKYAQLFSEKGYSTLAMSYYGGEGQKKNIRAIPLEQFQAAADEMKSADISVSVFTVIPKVEGWLFSQPALCRISVL